MKLADVSTPLQGHQQRIIDKLKASGGVLALHGMGSGKTLEYIAAHDALGTPAEYVVPAPLQQNLQKEYVKHTGAPIQDARVRSYEKAVREGVGNLDTSGLVVFDEAHRGRNNGTGAAKLLREAQKAPYRLLGTGTAIYNQPYDLANPLNAAAGSNVVPTDPSEFKNTFVGSRTIKPGLLNRIRGMKPVEVPALKNRQKLIDAATGYVDVHKSGTGPDFPRRVDEEFDVPMSDKQHDLYRFHEGPMPWYLRAKIRAGLPMDKQEAKELNAFQGALRQTSNTPRPYVDDMSDEEENENTPKIQMMVRNLLEQRKKDPNFRGVVYSNYHAGGLHPYARALRAANVPHNLFTGETAEKDRARIIQEYNEGKSPVLLVSGAGTEGLDLKGTKMVQLTEPHWNNSRLDQAIARGIRFKSHSHLPENEREVRVQRYFSAFPKTLGNKLHLTTPDKTVERYMYDMSNTKSELANQMMGALQEASDRGPLHKIAARRGVKEVRKLFDQSRDKGNTHAQVNSLLQQADNMAPAVMSGRTHSVLGPALGAGSEGVAYPALTPSGVQVLKLHDPDAGIYSPGLVRGKTKFVGVDHPNLAKIHTDKVPGFKPEYSPLLTEYVPHELNFLPSNYHRTDAALHRAQQSLHHLRGSDDHALFDLGGHNANIDRQGNVKFIDFAAAPASYMTDVRDGAFASALKGGIASPYIKEMNEFARPDTKDRMPSPNLLLKAVEGQGSRQAKKLRLVPTPTAKPLQHVQSPNVKPLQRIPATNFSRNLALGALGAGALYGGYGLVKHYTKPTEQGTSS